MITKTKLLFLNIRGIIPLQMNKSSINEGIIMKIINEPIKITVIFHLDKKIETGQIEPVKFRYNDNDVKIQKILKIYEEKSFGRSNVIFVCQHNGKDVYELKYEVDSHVWYLFRVT